MGVPVTASLNGAFTSRAHSFARVFGFFTNCASSRINPVQSTVANCSKSSRKTAYEVTTTSAPDVSCSIETPSLPSVLGRTTTSRSGVNRPASDSQLPITDAGATTRNGARRSSGRVDRMCSSRANTSRVLPSPMSSARTPPSP